MQTGRTRFGKTLDTRYSSNICEPPEPSDFSHFTVKKQNQLFTLSKLPMGVFSNNWVKISPNNSRVSSWWVIYVPVNCGSAKNHTALKILKNFGSAQGRATMWQELVRHLAISPQFHRAITLEVYAISCISTKRGGRIDWILGWKDAFLRPLPNQFGTLISGNAHPWFVVFEGDSSCARRFVAPRKSQVTRCLVSVCMRSSFDLCKIRLF